MSILEIMGCGGGVAAIIMTLLQVSAIKINPWSFLARKFGRAVNREIIEKVDHLEQDVQRIERKQDRERAVTARIRILRFADEMQDGRKHTKEHYDQTLEDIKVYEDYCDADKDFRNNIAVITIQYIKENYGERLRKHDFL